MRHQHKKGFKMKKITLILLTLIASTLFSTSAMADYFMSQQTVTTTYSFQSYVRHQPQMCNYSRNIPSQSYQCGIRASQVSGCSWYSNQWGRGYNCGSQTTQRTVCAWQVNWRTVYFVARCGRY